VPPALATRQFRSLRVRLPQPWSRNLGRIAYLPQLLRGDPSTRREFVEESLIERLVHGREPLVAVGPGLTERVIEIPWVLRSLPDAPATRVLDVGTAFAPMVYKRLLFRQPQRIEVADLADAEIAGLRSHLADVRDLPFAEDDFDVAVCVSTLEHVGMDNSNYDVASGGGGDARALRELGRVARTLFVTVPGGADADMGWQRQYSPDTFRRVVDRAGLVVARLEVYAHHPASGWGPAGEGEIGHLNYGERTVAAAAVICAELGRG